MFHHHAAVTSHAFMQHAQQRAEFALLEIVEAVVERLCGVPDLLDFTGRFGQAIRDFVDAIDGRRMLAFLFALAQARIASPCSLTAALTALSKGPQAFSWSGVSFNAAFMPASLASSSAAMISDAGPWRSIPGVAGASPAAA